MSLSRKTYKYHVNTMVMHKSQFKKDEPAMISSHRNSNPKKPDDWTYDILTASWGPVLDVPEQDLRPMTFREFVSFKNPATEEWMVGKTRGWMALIIHIISAYGIGTSLKDVIAYGNLASLSVAGIAAGVLVGFWIFTFRNYKGTTV